MLKNIGIILVLSSILFWSCEDPLQKEKEQLQEEVMAIHDEMMPQISTIRKTQKKLTAIIQNDDQSLDSVAIQKYQTAHQQLENADRAMHEWMKQFSTPTVEMSNEEAIQYLKDQKVKVTEMKDIMVKNMDAAKTVIEF